MSKAKNKKDSGKRPQTTNENNIFKKYAAPWSQNFLYFDKIQQGFYLMTKDKWAIQKTKEHMKNIFAQSAIRNLHRTKTIGAFLFL